MSCSGRAASRAGSAGRNAPGVEVDLSRAIQNSLELTANDVKDRLVGQGVTVVPGTMGTTGEVILSVPNAKAVEQVIALVRENPDLTLRTENKPNSFPKAFLRLSALKVDDIQANAVNQSLEILRNRIGQFGVAEAVIIRQGEDENNFVKEVDPVSKKEIRHPLLLQNKTLMTGEMIKDNRVRVGRFSDSWLFFRSADRRCDRHLLRDFRGQPNPDSLGEKLNIKTAVDS
jgi:preprotein translocase subunit SecD